MTSPAVFGPFTFDPGRGLLLRGGQPVLLGQRALAVLAALAGQPGRVVPKSELMDRVWPGTFVEEGNLSVQVAALRKALGEDEGGQGWIITVPRVGYRLMASGGAVADPLERPRLAVLPFDVLGGDESGRPGATVARIGEGQHAKEHSRRAPLLEGLRLAGLPEV